MKRLITISLLFVFPSIVAAEDNNDPYPPGYYAGGGESMYGHASTIQQGASEGVAEAVRSQGERNFMSSAAAKNIEDARQKYLENRALGMRTYYQIKAANQEYRSAQRREPPTEEEMSRINDSRRPEHLSSYQLDQATGAIRWPLALQDGRFREERNRIEQLYAHRAKFGELSVQHYLEVKKLTGDMLAVLQRQGDRLLGNERIDARKVLEGIAYDARLRTSAPVIARDVPKQGPLYAQAN